MYVAIIGNKNSGKTIFVSLLYATQIRYSEETGGNFRFISEPKVLSILGDQYNILRRGKWPKEKSISDISFSFGYDIESIGSKLKRMFKKKYEEPKIALTFGLFEIYDEKYDEETTALPKPLITEPNRLDSLVTSNIIIILLASSELGRTKTIDNRITGIIDKILRMKRGMVYPIIVYTKHDRINKKIIKKLKLQETPPDISKGKERKEYGQKILKTYYPNLSKTISNIETEYYFVHLNVEKDSDGKLVPSLSSDIDMELDYSYDEYYKLIEQLGKIGK